VLVGLSFHCSDYAVLSNFTLAFFEDSGWYKVNYTFMNNYDQFELQWGRGMCKIYFIYQVIQKPLNFHLIHKQLLGSLDTCTCSLLANI